MFCYVREKKQVSTVNFVSLCGNVTVNNVCNNKSWVSQGLKFCKVCQFNSQDEVACIRKFIGNFCKRYKNHSRKYNFLLKLLPKESKALNVKWHTTDKLGQNLILFKLNVMELQCIPSFTKPIFELLTDTCLQRLLQEMSCETLLISHCRIPQNKSSVSQSMCLLPDFMKKKFFNTKVHVEKLVNA